MADVIKVNDQDPAKKNSPIMKNTEAEATVVLDVADRICYWNDAELPEGTKVSSGGAVYECSYGHWVKV